MTMRIEPQRVAQAVDMYADGQLRDAAKYENRQPLDESGIWELHHLAAEIYAMGYEERHARRRCAQPLQQTARRDALIDCPNEHADRDEREQGVLT